MKFSIITFIWIFITSFSHSQTSESDVLGTWTNDKKTSNIEFYQEGDRYFAKVVWIKDTKEGVHVGDVVALNLKYNPSENMYEDGKFNWGRYKMNCEMKLLDKNTLELNLSKMLISRKVKYNRVE